MIPLGLQISSRSWEVWIFKSHNTPNGFLRNPSFLPFVSLFLHAREKAKLFYDVWVWECFLPHIIIPLVIFIHTMATPVKSEKPLEANLGAKPLEVVEKVLHSLQHSKEIPAHKAKLHELFTAIEKEFDTLYEENQERMCNSPAQYYILHILFCI